eukprot:772709-Pleurochrysis_carterae.AAC.1
MHGSAFARVVDCAKSPAYKRACGNHSGTVRELDGLCSPRKLKTKNSAIEAAIFMALREQKGGYEIVRFAIALSHARAAEPRPSSCCGTVDIVVSSSHLALRHIETYFQAPPFTPDLAQK